MFSPENCPMSLAPMPLMPTEAMLSFSLGAVCPDPASTCRGTIVNAATVAALLRNCLLFIRTSFTVQSSHSQAGPYPPIILHWSQRPSVAERRTDILIRLGEIRHLQIHWVPLERRVLEPHGKHAQQNHLRERAAVLEARTGRLAVLAGANPVLLVAALAATDPSAASSRAACRLSSSLRGSAAHPPAPWEPCMIVPFSPISSAPLPGSLRPGSRSLGRGGINRPSLHVTFTGGMLPRAGNSYRMTAARG